MLFVEEAAVFEWFEIGCQLLNRDDLGNVINWVRSQEFFPFVLGVLGKETDGDTGALINGIGEWE